MSMQSRIRLARRYAGLSQLQLAQAVGVQRSAVSHWEAAQCKSPNVSHLCKIALVAGVPFEWLATGRGQMTLCDQVILDSVPVAEAMLVDDPLEMRLLHAFRAASVQGRIASVELMEQLAVRRSGRNPSFRQEGSAPAGARFGGHVADLESTRRAPTVSALSGLPQAMRRRYPD